MRSWQAVRNRLLAVAGSASLVGACGGRAADTEPARGEATGGDAPTQGSGGIDIGEPPDPIGPPPGSGGSTSNCDREPLGRVPETCDDLWPIADYGHYVDPSAAIEACGCDPAQYQYQKACLPASDGVSCEELYDESCVASLYGCGLIGGASIVCGPVPDESGACCYVLGGGCAIGRPFLVAGRARTAQLMPSGEPGDQLALEVAELSEASRRALADAYGKDALTEHASVAAFARFILQCLHLGAPLDVVSLAQQALADEIEHARTCGGLARAYGATPSRPGPLDTSGALDEASDLAAVAGSVARESCIAETVSALLLLGASEAAQNPALRQLLAQMAEDEVRHAVLGFRFVRWALDQGGSEVAQSVAAAFARAPEAVGFGARTDVVAPAHELRAHGYLPIEERRRIAERALAQVIGPCARALLA